MVTETSGSFIKLKNPFTFGVPVSGYKEFFGRHEELNRIFNTLENVPRGQKQDIVVLGPRRIGKSSLLRHIEKKLSKQDKEFVPVYIDVQNVLPREIQTLFFKILTAINKGYHEKGITTLPKFSTLESDAIPPAREFLIFNQDMENLNQFIDEEKAPRLLLMFDEVELLLDFGGIRILEWLRSLIQSMTFTVFVVAGSDRLYSLTQDYGSPFYNIFKTIELFPLDSNSARKLIVKKALEIRMRIDNSEIEKILDYSGSSPYFVQGIAHYLVEELNEKKRYQVYGNDVDKVIIECVSYLSPQFGYYWNVASQPQRIILFALAKIGYQQTADELMSKLPSVKTFFPSRHEQLESFENLVQQQILQKDNENRYWFVVPLIVDWILSNTDDQEIIDIAKALRSGEIQDTSLIRRFLTLAFTDAELQEFIFELFRPLSLETSRGMSKGQIIDRLVDYATRNDEINRLITEAKARHPQQYTAFDMVIGMPTIMESTVIDTFEEALSLQNIDRIRVRQLMIKHFNEYELREIMFELRLDYESLPGKSKSEKVTELIFFMERHNRLDEMMKELQKQRPNVAWMADSHKQEEKIDTIKLYRILSTYFSSSELRDLAFDLKINYESLPGETTQDKARELVLYLDRRGLTDNLVKRASQLRPQVAWGEDNLKRQKGSDLNKLFDVLVKYFDENELRTLLFILRIDYDNLSGITKAAKAREIVLFMNRRDQIDDLAKAIQELRPGINLSA